MADDSSRVLPTVRKPLENLYYILYFCFPSYMKLFIHLNFKQLSTFLKKEKYIFEEIKKDKKKVKLLLVRVDEFHILYPLRFTLSTQLRSFARVCFN